MTDPTLEDEKESQEDSGKNQGVRLLKVDSPGKNASLKRKSVKKRSPTRADLEDGSSFAEDRDSEQKTDEIKTLSTPNENQQK